MTPEESQAVVTNAKDQAWVLLNMEMLRNGFDESKLTKSNLAGIEYGISLGIAGAIKAFADFKLFTPED